MVDEPTVLDYFKSLLTFWRGRPLRIPGEPTETEREQKSNLPDKVEGGGEYMGVAREMVVGATPQPSVETLATPVTMAWPWRSMAALVLALFAQFSLEPGLERTWITGAMLYVFAAASLVWAYRRGELAITPIPTSESTIDAFTVNKSYLLVGILLAALAFLTFGGNRFTSLNTLLWAVATLMILSALWSPAGQRESWLAQLRPFFAQPFWSPRVFRWTVVLLITFGVAIFFRFYRLTQVPPEMVSDHAEKLLDIWDVLHGQTSIFFPRNTGREAFQMYLTAGVIELLGTGFTFLSLKIGTVFGGLLTLPFIYLSGKEVGNRKAGLFALFLAGIAYWPNLISRIGLRFTLYPLFFAPTLYFFLRGIRTSNRNDFILSGIFLGIGLHGYSPFRFVPPVIAAGILLYLLHQQSVSRRKQALLDLLILAGVSLVVFLPLLRYALANPEMFSYRMLTRFGSLERPLPGSPIVIFLQNLWNALTMFAWDNGEVWVISITHRPVLDVISGALYHLGLVVLVVRYFRQRHWLDLFLIVSIPLLMMPSILSLAFPAENPSLNRTAGALVPVFLVAGIAMDCLFTSLKERIGPPHGRVLALSVTLVLFFLSARQNFDMVFNQYQDVYELSSWNTSEIAHVIRSFADSIGDAESAYVVGYPYWVDTRLIGFSAGYPTKDFAIWPDQFPDTLNNPRDKLFIINPQDSTALEALKALYRDGHLQLYKSRVETKDFLIFHVPPVE